MNKSSLWLQDEDPLLSKVILALMLMTLRKQNTFSGMHTPFTRFLSLCHLQSQERSISISDRRLIFRLWEQDSRDVLNVTRLLSSSLRHLLLIKNFLKRRALSKRLESLQTWVETRVGVHALETFLHNIPEMGWWDGKLRNAMTRDPPQKGLLDYDDEGNNVVDIMQPSFISCPRFDWRTCVAAVVAKLGQ